MSSEQPAAVRVFGIRHHGPGCARSLRQALEALNPDLVLVEGPPDADAVLSLAAHAEMHLPVALLVYRPDAPRRAVFYPFAEFSPEWQAIRFAQQRDVPVRFMDLPMAFQLARDEPGRKSSVEHDENDEDGAGDSAPPEEQGVAEAGRADPMTALAAAAGYDDPELWWEHQVERRQDAAGLFEAIAEVMQALRADAPVADRDLTREAFMRQTIRAALKEGRIAGAGLDVFWYEPFDPTDPIFSYNVIATPHVGGATDLSLQGIAKKVAENVNRARRGERPLNCANFEH